jgi:hypothetical protein
MSDRGGCGGQQKSPESVLFTKKCTGNLWLMLLFFRKKSAKNLAFLAKFDHNITLGFEKRHF